MPHPDSSSPPLRRTRHAVSRFGAVLLTLVLVPVLYHLLESGRARLSGWRQNRRTRNTGPGQDPDEDLDGLDDMLGDRRPGEGPAGAQPAPG